MKIFVSSRMRELFTERKIAIEAVHFAGHTPLYIETEPEVRQQEARNTMDALIDDADGFLSMFYLSEGDKDPILDDLTPIYYELNRFLKRKPEGPVLLFRKTHEGANPSESMLHWFEYIAKSRDPVVKFKTPQELHQIIRQVLRRKKYDRSKDDLDLPFEFTVRYVGPDYVGLIGKLAEVIFTHHRLNVDYISHAAHGGHSTVCLSCTPRQLRAAGEELDEARLEQELQSVVDADIEKAQTEGRWIPGTDPAYRARVVVNKDSTGKRRRQFYVQLRTIDAPGQLNAVCKHLRDMRYNIDELQLHPTPPEYPRQTKMTLWLSKLSGNHHDPQQDIDELEGALQYIVGVRSLSIRLAYAGSTKNLKGAARLSGRRGK